MSTDLQEQLSDLKTLLKSAAYHVLKGGPEGEREAHDKILDSLQCLATIESDINRSGLLISQPPAYTADKPKLNTQDEVRRVQNRLKLWVNRPNQINYRILKTYLELKRSRVHPITVDQLRAACAIDRDSIFDTNYSQMKIFAEKSHGKVFEQIGNEIEIWKEVEEAVTEFERKVFID